MIDKIQLEHKDFFQDQDSRGAKGKNRNRLERHGGRASRAWIRDFCESWTGDGLVIDAGCGKNMYKQCFNNCIGIDSSTRSKADIHTPILEATFEEGCADLVMAIGSIQFVDEEYCLANFDRVASWVKLGGQLLFRVKSAECVAHHQTMGAKTHHSPWTDDMIDYVVAKHNLRIDYYQEFYSNRRPDGVRDKLWLFSKQI